MEPRYVATTVVLFAEELAFSSDTSKTETRGTGIREQPPVRSLGVYRDCRRRADYVVVGSESVPPKNIEGTWEESRTHTL